MRDEPRAQPGEMSIVSDIRSGTTEPYALERSAHETQRLIVQHQMYGPITRQFLVAAGITVG